MSSRPLLQPITFYGVFPIRVLLPWPSLVKWEGKRDGSCALADWEKLPVVDPAYEEKA